MSEHVGKAHAAVVYLHGELLSCEVSPEWVPKSDMPRFYKIHLEGDPVRKAQYSKVESLQNLPLYI